MSGLLVTVSLVAKVHHLLVLARRQFDKGQPLGPKPYNNWMNVLATKIPMSENTEQVTKETDGK